jgi:hypothetical protein
MSEDQHGLAGLRDRIANGAEDRLGKALTDLLDNPVISGAIGRAFDAREKAAQAQELAMGALNLPSAADIERLTRRLRSLSQRIEGIEDGVARLDRGTAQRLGAIEGQLQAIVAKVDDLASRPTTAPASGEQAAKTVSKATGRSKSADSPSRPPRSMQASRSRSARKPAGGAPPK